MTSSASGSDPVAPDGLEGAEALIGRVLDGRYRIEAVLGTGGVGVVYRGVHTALARPVAIKVLHGSFGERDDLRKRFKREAKALSTLAHPHIVAITDYGVSKGMPYLVMELLEGQTLAQLLRSRGGATPDAAVDIARGVLRGLAFAHARGVLHRDLKPANVFLQRLPDDPHHVKLLDFGLAKMVEADDEATTELTLTRSGTVLGTPQYMSPEQASGSPVDTRTDVYSAGCVLFEMLAGRPPFVAKERPELIRMHLLEPVPSLGEVRPGLSPTPELAALLDRALRKEAQERFADATKMLEALDALPQPAVLAVPEGSVRAARGATDARRSDISEQPTVSERGGSGDPIAPPPELPEQVQAGPVRRRPLRWAAAVAVVAGLAVGGVGGFLAWRSAKPAKDAPLDYLGGPIEDIPLVGGSGVPPARARGTTLRSAQRRPKASRAEARPATPPSKVPTVPASSSPAASSSPPQARPQPSPADATQSSTSAAASPAPQRPAPRYLLAAGLPRALRPYWARVRRGRPLTRAQQRALRSYQQRAGNDPRPSLLLGHDFARRGWMSDALTRYEVAYRMDPASRGDPRMLRNMVHIASTGAVGDRADRLIEEIYGREAIPEVDRFISQERDPKRRDRLEELKRQLAH